MKKIIRVYLEQTQGRHFDAVAERFEELLNLTLEEEVDLLKELEAEDFEGAIHQKLYKLHGKATRQISKEEDWQTDPDYVEDGLCVQVVIEEV